MLCLLRWGTTVSGGQTPSNQLMFVDDVPIVSLPKCQSIYGFNAIREGMLCAGAHQQSAKGFCKVCAHCLSDHILCQLVIKFVVAF